LHCFQNLWPASSGPAGYGRGNSRGGPPFGGETSNARSAAEERDFSVPSRTSRRPPSNNGYPNNNAVMQSLQSDSILLMVNDAANANSMSGGVNAPRSRGNALGGRI